MSTPRSLIQMPNLVMGQILEYVDFPSILILRKVCHDLRDFIDVTKPASHLTKIGVYVYPEYINFKLCLTQRSFTVCVQYVKNGEGCLVKCHKDGKIKETLMENKDFVAAFCVDFNIALVHQKTVLEDFKIYFDSSNSTVKERVLEGVNNALNSLNHPLQVKSLGIEVSNNDEILAILPYMDPKPIKKIHIENPSRKIDNTVVLNIDEIGQLEQWKQADELLIYGFRLPHPAQNLKNFSRITLYLREVSSEELILLKGMFLCSSTLSLMLIYKYGNLSQDIIGQRLVESFGQHFVDSDQNRNWFFRIPESNQLIRITKKIFHVYFDCIEQSDVPRNARISN